MKKTLSRIHLFLFLLLLNTACNAEVIVPPTATIIPTSTPVAFITATLPATEIPYLSPTPEPTFTAMPIAPAEGQALSQLNVRNTPSEEGAQVGAVEIFETVQIVGKDPTNGWWMIVFPDSDAGTGWVTAKFVQVDDSSRVPIISTTPKDGEEASITDSGQNTSEPIPSVEPTPNFSAAPEDGDSIQSPAVNLTLSEVSIPSLTYSSEISSPEGDADDWVQFSLAGSAGQQQIVSVLLDCSGSGKLNIELLQNGVRLQNWDELICGQRRQLRLFLFVGAPYSLRFFPAESNAALNYLSYTVTVQLTK